jgi:tetratricopeptide (TPR) repeat protein
MNEPTEVDAHSLAAASVADMGRQEQYVWLLAIHDEIFRIEGDPTPQTHEFMLASLAAIARLPMRVNPLQRALALREISRYFYLANIPTRASEAAAAAVEAAAAGGYTEAEAKCRLALAISLREAGGLLSSLRELERALGLARELGLRHLEAKVQNSLGNWYREAGLNAEALDLFERLARFFDMYGDRFSMQMALDNAAMAALRVGAYEHGLRLSVEAAESWSGEVTSANDRLWMVQGVLPYCELLIQAGRTEEALASAKLAEVVARGAEFAQCRLLSALALSIAKHAMGHCGPEIVLETVDQCHGDSPMMFVSALQVAIRAFEYGGQTDLALGLQQRLIDFNRHRKFDEVHKALGCPSPDESLGAAKLVRLTGMVDARLADLTRIAVDQSVRAGADDARVFRVGCMAGLFADYLRIEARRVASIALAGRLLDIGTMIIPDGLLSSPRVLSAPERAIVDQHANFSGELLANARLAVLQPCVRIVRCHHERWDGRGPGELTGQEIPYEARLVALCDAYDALIHDRPWRKAHSRNDALAVIRAEAGSRFDPELTDRFIGWIERLQEQVPDLDAYFGSAALDNDYVRMRSRIDRLVHGSA